MHQPAKQSANDDFPVPPELQQFVQLADLSVVTDSRTVAREFGKTHFNVLRDIRGLLREVPADFAKLNFEFCHEISDLQNGKPQPYYRITKDGFALLVMGFTGKKAMAIKIAFLQAFNALAEFHQTNAVARLRDYNRVFQLHLADKRVVSQCGREMRRWQDIKPRQLAELARLNPQLVLFPTLRQAVESVT